MTENDLNKEVAQLRSQVTALEQLLAVQEQTALEQANRLEASLSLMAKQVQTSTEIAQELGMIANLPDMLQHIGDLLQARFGYYGVSIYLQERDVLVAQGGVGEVGRRLVEAKHTIPVNAKQSLIARATQSGKPILVANVLHEPAWLSHPYLAGVLSEIAVPIKLQERVLGVINVQSDRENGITTEDQLLLLGLAGQIAIALDQRRMVGERQQIAAALDESEQRFQQIVSSIGSHVYVTEFPPNSDPLNRYLSPNVEQLTGYPFEKFVDDWQFWQTTVIHPDDYEIAMEQLARLARGFSSRLDYRLIRADGNVIWVNDNAQSIKNEQDRQVVVYGIVSEITDIGETLLETRVLYEINQTVSRIGALEEGLVAVLEALNGSEFDARIDSIALTSIETDIAEGPTFATIKAWIHRDGSDALIPIGTRYSLEDVALIGYWMHDSMVPAFLEDIQVDASIDEGMRDWYLQLGVQSALLMPLFMSGRWIGLLSINWSDRRNFSESERRIYQALMNQLTIVVDNLQLFEQERQRASESEDALNFVDSIIENIPNMVFVKDAQELKFVRFNKAGENLLGIKREVMLGQSDYDIFPKDEAAFFVAKDREVLTQGKLLEIPEESIHTAHQGVRWLHTRKVPVFGTDGQPRYLLGVSEDITERKKAEAVLIKQANELSAVAEVGTATATILDVDRLLQEAVNLTQDRFQLYHVHLYLLDDTEDMLVLRAGSGPAGQAMVIEGWQIALKQTQSLVARAARSRRGVLVNDVRADAGFLPHPLLPETQSEMAVPLIARDQLLGVLDVQANQLDYFAEEDLRIYAILAGQIAIALQNADFHRQTQDALEQARSALQVANTFRQFAETSGQGMGIATLEGEMIYANPTLAEIVGEDKFNAPSGNSFVEYYPPDIQQQLQAEVLPSVLREGQWTGELGLISATGQIIPTIENFFLIRDDEGNPQYLAYLVTDISDRKVAETEQARLLAEVEATVRYYVSEQWAEFLTEYHASSWQIEHQQPGLDLSPASETLATIQAEVIQTGQAKLTSAKLNNGSQSQIETQPYATLVTPISLRGQIIGALSLEDIDSSRDWSEDDVALVNAVTEQLALTVENLRLFEEAQKRAGREAVTRQITDKMRALPDVESIIRAGISELSQVLGASRVYVKLKDESHGGE